MLLRRRYVLASVATVLLGGTLFAMGCGSSSTTSLGLPADAANLSQVIQGRHLVTTSGCVDCHNRGVNDPAGANWLAGVIAGVPGPGSFDIGPFHTYAANITPDATNGIGKYTDRQIYNALKFGLDPEDTPSVTIQGTTPGSGNYPADPHYLAPPMPWFSTRHMTDSDLWAIVAYLKHGVKANANAAPESEGPPDHWASSYTDATIGPSTLPTYPATNEVFNP